MGKYELTKDTITINGDQTLYRIKALRDFGDVKAGDLGGYVQSENNLSHEGDCWIYDEAKVYDDAEVSGSAWICGSAEVFESARIYGSARIFESARVGSSAEVFDNARIFGSVWIPGTRETWL